MEKLGETIPVEEKVLLRTRNVTLTRRADANSSQEGQNSRRTSRKVCRSFAEAPRKGGPVFAGKRPSSMGSPMEPKPTQAAAEHYLT